MPLIKKRLALALAAVSAAVAVGAPAATPATLTDPTLCEGQSFSQVFAPWGDKDHYTLAPAGDFETLAKGWKLEGDARVVRDQVDQRGTGADHYALFLGTGASAYTPAVCVTDAHRSIRFFSRLASSGKSSKDQLRVDLFWKKGAEKARSVTIGYVTPGSTWAPTPILKIDTTLYQLELEDPTTTVQFRLTAQSGTIELDDVYVDPRMI